MASSPATSRCGVRNGHSASSAARTGGSSQSRALGVRDVLGVELAAERPGFGRRERAQHLGDEQLAGHVVRLAERAGPVAGAQDGLVWHGHPHAVHSDLQVARRHLLQIAHRAAEHAHHLGVALDHGGRGIVGPALTPGKSSPIELSTTSVSPRDGRTWLM